MTNVHGVYRIIFVWMYIVLYKRLNMFCLRLPVVALCNHVTLTSVTMATELFEKNVAMLGLFYALS